MPAYKPIPPGTRFTRLIVIGPSEPRINPDGSHRGKSLCRCDCGNERAIDNYKLKSGHTKSCGCLVVDGFAASETDIKSRIESEFRDVERGFTTPCREWITRFDSNGYGILYFQGKERLVHRIAWTLITGPIPDGLDVCHRCDNPPCFRMDHLFLGTHSQNMADRDKKGRNAKGEKIHTSKLTTEQVLEIRSSYIPRKVTLHKLSERYGVSTNQIFQILKRHNWKHI